MRLRIEQRRYNSMLVVFAVSFNPALLCRYRFAALQLTSGTAVSVETGMRELKCIEGVYGALLPQSGCAGRTEMLEVVRVCGPPVHHGLRRQNFFAMAQPISEVAPGRQSARVLWVMCATGGAGTESARVYFFAMFTNSCARGQTPEDFRFHAGHLSRDRPAVVFASNSSNSSGIKSPSRTGKNPAPVWQLERRCNHPACKTLSAWDGRGPA